MTKTRHPALQALVPSKEVANTYIPRVLPGGHTDLEILEHAWKSGVNVLMKGDTGAGKTMAARAFAAKHGLAFINVACNGGADVDSLFGRTEIVGGETVFEPGDLTIGWGEGDVVVNLDEVNALPISLGFVFHGAFDGRRVLTVPGAAGVDGGSLTIPAGPRILVVAGYNPGYHGVTELNQAFANRFGIHLDYPYDVRVERMLVVSPSLLRVAKGLREAYKVGDLSTPVSTNRLMTFEDLVDDVSYEFAVENFINQFHDDERGAVREAFRVEDANLRSDYELDGTYVDDPLDEAG